MEYHFYFKLKQLLRWTIIIFKKDNSSIFKTQQIAGEGVYRGAVPLPRPLKGGVAPPLELRAITIFKSEFEEWRVLKTLICCFFSAMFCLIER